MLKLFSYLSQGGRIFLTSLKSRYKKKEYPGNVEEICQQVIRDCWNGRFFQTSTTNFPQFWTRDFGWCVKSLLELGYYEKVQQTLRYAMNRFKKHKQITTTLTPKGNPFDFPCQAVDSLPYFIHSLKISKFPYQKYKKFLNWQIRKFFSEVIDPATGLVKSKHFSSIKDFAIRTSSCYDNVMVALLAKDLKTMKLKSPFEKYDYPELIKKHFWNGKFFYDDLTKQDYVAGDANVFPFALGIIQDEDMLRSCLEEIRKAGLDKPLPLKYTNKEAKVKFVSEERFLKDYEFDSVWTHMGLFYIQLLYRINPPLAEKHKLHYGSMIESYGNYLEVFSSDQNKLKPFQTPFYYCDQGMLWAANYLTL